MEQFDGWDEFTDVVARGVDGALAWRAELDDALTPARELLEQAEAMPTGSAHVAALAQLQEMFLDEALQIRLTQQWTRAESWIQAQKLQAITNAANVSPDLRAAAVYDIARFTSQTEHAVARQVALGDTIRESLGETWVALHAGHLTYPHLLALYDVIKHADADVAREVQARVLPKSLKSKWTPSRLRRAALTALEKVDRDGAEKRARNARKRGSSVWFSPDSDGMAALVARGSAFPARQMMDEINRAAEAIRRAGDERSLGELQFEALRRAVLGEDGVIIDDNHVDGDLDADEPDDDAAGAGSSRGPSKRTTALLLVPLSTLLGGDLPGQLEGYGPINAAQIREVANSDLTFRRLVFDDLTGRPVDLGTRSYRLSAEMRRWIDAFDRTCRAPGCTTPAAYCDADHGIEWPDGDTSCDNCGLLCRRHHGLKTKKLFKLKRNRDRSIEWTSPFGFTYTQEPATYDDLIDDTGPPPLVSS
jgi:hypothetical protein